jgi:hypothetical protein
MRCWAAPLRGPVPALVSYQDQQIFVVMPTGRNAFEPGQAVHLKTKPDRRWATNS